MKLLEGKVAIVTGAARGIGAGIVLKFAEQGADIAFTYVSDSSAEKAAELEARCTAFGVKAKSYKSNAGDFASCESFVNDVLKEFGKIDVLVNNAGISKDNLLLRITPEQWDEVMTTNLKSVFNMTKLVMRHVCFNKTGGNGIAADVAAAQFMSDGFCKSNNAGLTCCIAALACVSAHTNH